MMMKLPRSLPVLVWAIIVMGSSSGSAGEPAKASSAVVAPPLPPPLPPVPSSVRGNDIPAERSPVPKPGEWTQAKEVAITGMTSCKARVLREWLSIRCDEHYGASLVAGDSKDVSISANGPLLEWDPVADKAADRNKCASLRRDRREAGARGASTGSLLL